jgi:hypothetical protein
MIRQRTILISSLLALTLTIPLVGADMPTSFEGTHYHVLSLGNITVDVFALMDAAQTAGRSVIWYQDDTATVFKGSEQADVDVSTALQDESVLLIDGAQFMFRQSEESYTFTIRPSEAGYELVVNPSVTLLITDTLTSILTTLQELGIPGAEVNLGFTSYAKADLKGPASPAGILIESTLYGLVVADDWFTYASMKGLNQVGLRVEVVAEKLPGGVLDAAFSGYVLEETTSLVKLLCPISELVTLAKDSAIGYVRTAYQPSIP